MNGSLRVVIVTVADLPEGGGRTSRLKTLAASVAHSGHSVFVLVEHALTAAPDQQAAGSIGNGAIRFEYALRKIARPFGFSAAWMKVRAVYALWRWLAAALGRQELDVIMFNNLALYDMLPLTLFAKWKGIPTVQCYEDERMEIVSTASLGLARRLFGINSWLADRVCPPMANAIVVISEHLRTKYANLSKHRCSVFVVPTILDCDEWSAPPETQTDCPRLLYSGTFSEQDEIEMIIEALAVLRKQGRRFEADFIGATPSHPRVASLSRQIAALDLEGCVHIRPFMSLARVRQEVRRANILLCIRRDSAWARSGQATKLSEYLASGRLVITSDVGDNCKYLENYKSALIVSAPISVIEVSKVIDEAIQSPALRHRIGLEGRRVAEMHFDVKKVAPLMNRILLQAAARRAERQRVR